MENVKKFYKALSSDAAMRQRAKAVYDKGIPTDEAEAANAIIAFAKSEGYDFTAEELKAAAGAKELSDEELENVAGGGCFQPDLIEPSCFCFVGGGGTHEGVTCACVIGGGGSRNPGPGLTCAGMGTTKRPEPGLRR